MFVVVLDWMPLEIYREETSVSSPSRKKSVSSSSSSSARQDRKPLTPLNNRNRRSSKKMMADSKSSRLYGKTQHRLKSDGSNLENTKHAVAMQTSSDKENESPSSLNHLRRSLRATMVPSSSTKSRSKQTRSKKAEGVKKPFGQSANTTPKRKVGFSHPIERQGPQPSCLDEPKTPKSILKTELSEDADMSLLAGDLSLLASPSPTATFNKDVVPTNRGEVMTTQARTKNSLQQFVAKQRSSRMEQAVITPATTLELPGHSPLRTPQTISTKGQGLKMDLSCMFSEARKTARGRSKQDESHAATGQNVTRNVLSLDGFRKELWIDFGTSKKNQVGKPRSLAFDVQASSETTLEIEKIPAAKGIFLLKRDPSLDSGSLSKSDFALTTFRVRKEGSRTLWVLWRPVESGGMKETIRLKLTKGWAQIVLIGQAAEGPKSTPKVSNKVNRLLCRQDANVLTTLTFLSAAPTSAGNTKDSVGSEKCPTETKHCSSAKQNGKICSSRLYPASKGCTFYATHKRLQERVRGAEIRDLGRATV